MQFCDTAECNSALRACETFVLAAFIFALSLVIGVGQPVKSESRPSADQGSPAPVLDTRPSKDSDLLLQRSGEKLTGTIRNEALGLQTPYGALKFDRRMIASVDLKDDLADPVTIVTVNSNRFSGFLLDASIQFQPDKGSQLSIRPEKLRKVILRMTELDVKARSQSPLIVLKNGDYFAGKILNDPTFTAENETNKPIRLSDLELVQFSGRGLLRVNLRWPDGRIQDGKLEREDLNIHLDAGPEITVYYEHIEMIYCRGGDFLRGAKSPEVQGSSYQVTKTPVATPPNFPTGLAWIGPGRFTMGSPSDELDRGLDEGPAIPMQIQQGFWMGKYEVTQGEYLAIMGINPSHYAGDPARPVEKVSWQDAVEYCSKLTKRDREAGRLPDGYSYRLPTEAEWEYACRAGTKTRFSFGDDPDYSRIEDHGWYTGNSRSITHPVGTKRPNSWGLYDMHGNVWEWCQDYLNRANSSESPKGTRQLRSSLRGARGGSWLYDAHFCRSANRDDYFPSNRCSDLGFRVILAPSE
jgi:formylglycine-generating enzyme required for sulfatase activity